MKVYIITVKYTNPDRQCLFVHESKESAEAFAAGMRKMYGVTGAEVVEYVEATNG